MQYPKFITDRQRLPSRGSKRPSLQFTASKALSKMNLSRRDNPRLSEDFAKPSKFMSTRLSPESSQSRYEQKLQIEKSNNEYQTQKLPEITNKSSVAQERKKPFGISSHNRTNSLSGDLKLTNHAHKRNSSYNWFSGSKVNQLLEQMKKQTGYDQPASQESTQETPQPPKKKKLITTFSQLSFTEPSPKSQLGQHSTKSSKAVIFPRAQISSDMIDLKKKSFLKHGESGSKLASMESASQLSSEAELSVEATSDLSNSCLNLNKAGKTKKKSEKKLAYRKPQKQGRGDRLAKLASLLDGLAIDLEVIEEMEEAQSDDDYSDSSSNSESLFKLEPGADELLKEDLANKIRKKKPPRGKNTYMFGDNREGKCGIASPEAMVKVPTPLSGLFKKISCGFHHTLALDSNNLLYGWGRNSFGQIGQGEEISSEGDCVYFPTLVQGPLHCVVISEISCGYQHSMALTPNGFLFAWGLNLYGQLGTSDFRDRNEPALVKALTTHKVTNFSAGHMHSGAITDQGKMFLWGHNPDCRLFKKLDYYKKSGKTVNYCRPQLVEGVSNAQFYEVSCGTSHTLALDHLGYVYSAGSPANGQLGVPPSKFLPDMCEQPFVTIPGFCMSFPAEAISAGDGFSLALDRRGRVYSCGKGDFGRLANGGVHSEWTMHEIKYFKLNRIRISKIYAGGRHSLAISEDTSEKIPRLFGWGFGFYHQLGRGKKEDALEPVEIDMKGFPVEEASCGYFMSASIIDSAFQFH